MYEDKNGVELQVGDKVTIEMVVLQPKRYEGCGGLIPVAYENSSIRYQVNKSVVTKLVSVPIPSANGAEVENTAVDMFALKLVKLTHHAGNGNQKLLLRMDLIESVELDNVIAGCTIIETADRVYRVRDSVEEICTKLGAVVI